MPPIRISRPSAHPGSARPFPKHGSEVRFSSDKALFAQPYASCSDFRASINRWMALARMSNASCLSWMCSRIGELSASRHCPSKRRGPLTYAMRTNMLKLEERPKVQEGPQMHKGKLFIHINSTSSLSLGFQPSSNNISHHIISWLRTSLKQPLTTLRQTPTISSASISRTLVLTGPSQALAVACNASGVPPKRGFSAIYRSSYSSSSDRRTRYSRDPRVFELSRNPLIHRVPARRRETHLKIKVTIAGNAG